MAKTCATIVPTTTTAPVSSGLAPGCLTVPPGTEVTTTGDCIQVEYGCLNVALNEITQHWCVINPQDCCLVTSGGNPCANDELKIMLNACLVACGSGSGSGSGGPCRVAIYVGNENAITDDDFALLVNGSTIAALIETDLSCTATTCRGSLILPASMAPLTKTMLGSTLAPCVGQPMNLAYYYSSVLDTPAAITNTVQLNSIQNNHCGNWGVFRIYSVAVIAGHITLLQTLVDSVYDSTSNSYQFTNDCQPSALPCATVDTPCCTEITKDLVAFICAPSCSGLNHFFLRLVWDGSQWLGSDTIGSWSLDASLRCTGTDGGGFEALPWTGTCPGGTFQLYPSLADGPNPYSHNCRSPDSPFFVIWRNSTITSSDADCCNGNNDITVIITEPIGCGGWPVCCLCLPDAPLNIHLSATISDGGGCACLDGIQVDLDYNIAAGAWLGVTAACAGYIHLVGYCNGSDYALFIICNNNSSVYDARVETGGTLTEANMTSCTPFSWQQTTSLPSSGCCDGGHVTITLME